MKTPIHRELEVIGPIVDRLADIAVAMEFGDITEREYRELRDYYMWLWGVAIEMMS